MSGDGDGTTFNIGRVESGITNFAGRDQLFYGDQRGEVVTLPTARKAVRDLSDAVERTGLHADAAVRRQAEGLGVEMRSAEPDRTRVAGYLDGLARAIATAGYWLRAGAAVVGPMRVLATWLGSVGVSILSLLPVL